jgi:hypothetical protein
MLFRVLRLSTMFTSHIAHNSPFFTNRMSRIPLWSLVFVSPWTVSFQLFSVMVGIINQKFFYKKSACVLPDLPVGLVEPCTRVSYFRAWLKQHGVDGSNCATLGCRFV